jgi:hypothetical protein
MMPQKYTKKNGKTIGLTLFNFRDTHCRDN